MNPEVIIDETPEQEFKEELLEDKPEFSNKTTQPTTGPIAEFIQPQHSIEETSKNQSEPGEEIILYTEGFENSPEVQKIKKVFRSYLIYAFSFFSTLFFISAASISIYIRQVPDFSFLILALIYYHFFQIPMTAIKITRQFNNGTKLFRNIMNTLHHISFILAYLGIYFFLIGVIQGQMMFYFTILNVLVQIIRYTCTNYSEELIVSVPFLNLIASMCIMMIAIKLESPINHAAWGFVMLWYYLFYYFCIIILVALITCGILFVYFSIFDPDVIALIETQKLNLIIVLGVMLFLLILSVCTLMSGIKVFLELGLIAPNLHAQSMPSFLLKSAIFSIFYSFCMIICVLTIYFFYQELLIRKFFKIEGKSISFKTYLNDLRLKIQRVSANYFIKESDKKNQPELSVKAEDINLGENENCMICCENSNTILLQPCKHYIFCEPCVVEFLKHKSSCPMCKARIEKAVVMYYDPEKKEYFATKSIKLNEEIAV